MYSLINVSTNQFRADLLLLRLSWCDIDHTKLSMIYSTLHLEMHMTMCIALEKRRGKVCFPLPLDHFFYNFLQSVAHLIVS